VTTADGVGRRRCSEVTERLQEIGGVEMPTILTGLAAAASPILTIAGLLACGEWRDRGARRR